MDLIYFVAAIVVITVGVKVVTYVYLKYWKHGKLRYNEETISIVQEKSKYDVDKLHYQEGEEKLEALNYKRLVELESSANTSTYVSSFLSLDGRITCSLYSLRKPANLGTGHSNIFDFESEPSIGGFIVTTNAYSARHIKNPPEIDIKYYPENTSFEDLLQSHTERVHGKALRKYTTVQDLLDSQARLNEIKWEHRKSLGGRITFSEIFNLDRFKDKDHPL